ncbi:hypothetical protein PSHT_09035 [Puccinia striiformis]|uniref:Uncharacterized protein n=1 Tax=Puccinia striiformis TaxID=27350 RepID=A0A2S4VJI0_9BASI|nr:hypothetical protein PSHT_09035 [Puccinia striiformis]
MSRSTSGESAPKRRATEPAIQSVEYGNAESVGSSRWAKLIRFDIVCVTDTNQIVDVEMQVAAENHFLDRLTFYSSRLITERQGWPGNRVPTNLLDQTVQNTLGCELVKQRASQLSPLQLSTQTGLHHSHLRFCVFLSSTIPGSVAKGVVLRGSYFL